MNWRQKSLRRQSETIYECASLIVWVAYRGIGGGRERERESQSVERERGAGALCLRASRAASGLSSHVLST